MEFIVIVIGLLLIRQMGSLGALQSDQWFLGLLVKLRKGCASMEWLTACVAIALPVLILAALLLFLTDRWLGLPVFLISLLVFLYSLGRGDLEKDVENYQEDLDRGDEQAAYNDIVELKVGQQQGEVETATQSHAEAVRTIAYRYFERYFAVMFWFILAGAPGALLYRLSVIYDQQRLQDSPQTDFQNRWLWLLEWLPVRLVGISLAVVGNFPACLARLSESIVSSASSVEVLGNFTLAASLTGGDQKDSFVGKAGIEALFTRTLIFAVFMVAVLVVLL